MTVDNKLSLTITFHSDGVTRKFGSSYKDTQFGLAIQKIAEQNNKFAKHLANDFGNIHNIDSSRLENILIKYVFNKLDERFGEQRVPWYLSEFYTTLKAAYESCYYSRYSITVKACREHYFYVLEGEKKNGGLQLIHNPFFQKATPPTCPEEEMEKVRGLADTIFFLAPQLLQCAEEKSFIDLISWFDIKLRCTVLQSEADSLTLMIDPEIGISKYISLPPKNRPILMVSPNVRNAIGNLSEAWLNPTAKSVLLSAWTGSGKEVLVDLLTDAMHINRERNRINVSAPTIGKFQNLKDIIIQKCFKETTVKLKNTSLKKFNTNLPHKFKDKICYDKEKKLLIFKGPMSEIEREELLELLRHEEYQNAVKELFQQSLKLRKRTILFLDEIHHDTAKDLRSGLLRLIETDELEKDTGESLDCKPILYVFATSLPPEKIRTKNPPDLWTRIEYTVKLRHPMLIENNAERKETLKEYFLLFWAIQMREWEESIKSDTIHITKTFLDQSLIDQLSKGFVKELGSPLIPLISIRVLRSIVKRLFSRTVNYLRMNPQLRDADNVSDKISDAFKKWIVEVFNEIVPEIDTRGLF